MFERVPLSKWTGQSSPVKQLKLLFYFINFLFLIILIVFFEKKVPLLCIHPRVLVIQVQNQVFFRK